MIVLRDFAFFHAERARVLGQLGRYPEAVTEILAARASVRAKNSPAFLGEVGYLYARSGDVANARKTLAEIETWQKQGYTVRAELARVHLGLHEFDLALDEFDHAVVEGEHIHGLLTDPILDDIRALPRYQVMPQKAGLKKL